MVVTFNSICSAAVQRNVPSPPPPSTPDHPSSSPRSNVLRIGAKVGGLCTSILTCAPLDPPHDIPSHELGRNEPFPTTLSHCDFWSKPSEGREEIVNRMGEVFLALFVMARACGLDLRICVLKKIELNGRKYPVELCKVSL